LDLSLQKLTDAKVLIIDDEPTTSLVLGKGLNQRGFATESTSKGNEGLSMALSGKYSLVLLDIEMPEMDGFQVLAKIREKFDSFALPVIMFTGRESPEDVVKALKMNANDYITKPINLDVAEARVKTQLSVSKLYQESLEKGELEAVKATMVTYNHEINNPLAIAMLAIQTCETTGDTKILARGTKALERIAELVRKITDLEHGRLEPLKKDYVEGGSKMLDLGSTTPKKKSS
jgi:DNA-binding response OmpR family regulator